MDAERKDRIARRVRVIKALGHPSRLAMVEELAIGERCVCELRDLVEADMSTVSKHLALLREAGLVQEDKRGTFVYYSLRTPCILRFLDCVESVVKASTTNAPCDCSGI